PTASASSTPTTWCTARRPRSSPSTACPSSWRTEPARPARQPHAQRRPDMVKLKEHAVRSAAPITRQHARELQAFGTVVPVPIALAESVRRASVTSLNQLLADTLTLRDLYKKHHWQVSGATFHQLH